MEEKSNSKNDSTDESLAFFGAVTASVSHELNNVIAIMDQTTGLLEDKLSGGEGDIVLPAEKLEKIVVSLQKQAGRGLEIIKRMNRFAHSADEPTVTFDVNATLENLVRLTDRLAGLKGASLETRFSPDAPQINGNPFLLQQAVFAAITGILKDIDKGEEIVIASRPADGGVEIEIRGPFHDDQPDIADFDPIRNIMDRTAGRMDIDTSGQSIIVRLIPGT